MATLVFGALGTLVGGPLGGAIGSLLGRELDRQIVGVPTREGPRLKELAVSTSSYGQPIARLFGATRAAGTIVWATDLSESSETVSGGKGRPGTTQYSYTISLAVALSSRPIERVGRIWADGNLLRGAAGDLKTGGSLRVHLGHADQAPDPLLAAALGAECPAHRGLAYAVFEDLALGEFGNRIPALSFEVVASGGGERIVAALLEPVSGARAQSVPAAAAIAGFAHEGGTLAAVLATLGQTVPLVADLDPDAGAGGLLVGPEPALGEAPILPPAIAWPDGEFGTRTGQRLARERRAAPGALRYYDSARDYQPGLQRAAGRAASADERTLELPATLSAQDAAGLIDAAAIRALAAGDLAQLRVASLDPALAPGKRVALGGRGVWRVESWEWRSGGVELGLARLGETAAVVAPAAPSDAGNPWRPADRLPAATVLAAFELPWDGLGAADAGRLHVAAGAAAGRWAGAALYIEREGALVPLAAVGPAAAVTGTLAAPLAASPALMFEAGAALEIDCDTPSAAFASSEGAAFAAGANRLLVGEEVLQFMRAEVLAGSRWRLSGLLRGRGATEGQARAGHLAGARAVLLDERLALFDAAVLDPARERLAAIGAGEAEPVLAAVATPGRSRQPPAPVHPVALAQGDGGLRLEWTRRARGGWRWPDGVEVALVEESEAYEVGAGPLDAPLASWRCPGPALVLPASALAALRPGTALWVRQIGSHAKSPALLLHTII